jgi:hypothetical protein
MRLADRITQCRTPFIVQNGKDGSITHLSGAATFANEILACPTRYVLCDDLTRLCAALVYSKGTSALACADLLHVPAERVWIEWCEAPWLAELARYGFKIDEHSIVGGRHGVLIQSSATGRRGLIRAFWENGASELDLLASSMEAYFDFDTPEGEVPAAPDASNQPTIRVFDHTAGEADILRRCFRFRYEHVGRILCERSTLSRAERSGRAPCAWYDCDGNPPGTGFPTPSCNPPGSAAATAHARAAESSTVKVWESPAPVSDRSARTIDTRVLPLCRRSPLRHRAAA